jgi:hypothetical protein
MSHDWQCSWDLGEAPYFRDICFGCKLDAGKLEPIQVPLTYPVNSKADTNYGKDVECEVIVAGLIEVGQP